MQSERQQGNLQRFWQNWSIYLMMLLFVIVIFGLISRQYATFDTRSSDLDRFIQGMWNTVNGRMLYSTIEERSIMGGHFTPLFALLSPLLLLWKNPLVLSLAQTVGLAFAGLFMFHIVRDKHPKLAPFFVLAFFLNPSLHQIGLLELRRITFAVPFLAFALLGLARNNRKWVFIGLFGALLCKENMALPMAMIGLYYLAFHRDWQFGGALIGVAVLWVLMVITIVNPIVDPQYTQAENSLDAYRGFNYFAEYGDTPGEIVLNLLRQPSQILGYMFNAEAQVGLGRLFVPLGVILPFLYPQIAVIALPLLGYMLIGSFENMHQLEVWYVSSLLTILFAAIGFRIRQLSEKWAGMLTAVLLITTLIGYKQHSFLPFGGRYNPIRNQITQHHKTARQMLKLVPDNASLATQSAFTPHLSLREEIYLYPWLPASGEPLDYYLLDRDLKSYPMGEIERNDAINNLIADPNLVIEQEADGIYLFNLDGQPLPAVPINQTWDKSIHLERIELALTDEQGFYQPQPPEFSAEGEQTVRVTMYWEALAPPEVERTVSVRLSDGGVLHAQHDSQPSSGARPTSWWQTGWEFRDVYYVTIPETFDGTLSLEMLLYDSHTQEPVPNDDGKMMLPLATITVR